MAESASPELKAEVAQRLRLARIARSLTQEELATAVGTSQPMVSQWEKAANMPGSKYRNRICEVLEISLDWLFAEPSADPEDSTSGQRVAAAISALEVWTTEELTLLAKARPETRRVIVEFLRAAGDFPRSAGRT